ncbi:hypothetical protein KI387_030814 [Taxus chinensis]|uniref:NYN domain-containing protein n=1 Tax=Taxus chinensis TaxID=29808 RepID=A0AA38CEL6_TAXCH|nr:hypothetical protein KI387_030814 [Taxus chinensis]
MLGLKLFGVAASAKKHVFNSCSHGGMRKEACREKSEPNLSEFESTTKHQLPDSSNFKNSEPNSCDSTPGKAQCVFGQPLLGIFWDLETCGVPKRVPHDAVPVNIKTFLSRHGINEKIATFNAYGDVSTFP